jgi:alpha-1,2-glucosyltransferase
VNPLRPSLSIALIAMGIVAGIALVTPMAGPAGDENYYSSQIRLFMLDRYELVPGITMIPGYHLMLSWLARPFGPYSDPLARMVNLAGALVLLPAAWKLSGLRAPLQAPVRTAQIFFQPLLFPFFFLIYTDAWSLAALAWMLLGALERRMKLAALAAVIGTVMRQDFMVWVAMTYCVVAWEITMLGTDRGDRLLALRRAVVVGFPLLLVILAFVAFVIWNGAVALGDRSRHEAGVNPTNVYLFLICAWFLLLPMNLDAMPRVLVLLRSPAVAFLVLAGFAAYLSTYSNTHVYNQESLRFYLHNEVLHWISGSIALRAVLYLPLAWMLLTWITACRDEPRLGILLAFTVAFLAAHPLIEQRYYLPALFLLNVFRAPLAPAIERGLLVAYIPLALAALHGIAAGRFFL